MAHDRVPSDEPAERSYRKSEEVRQMDHPENRPKQPPSDPRSDETMGSGEQGSVKKASDEGVEKKDLERRPDNVGQSARWRAKDAPSRYGREEDKHSTEQSSDGASGVEVE
jgi:hypothetical protein